MAANLNDITDFEIMCRICLKKKTHLISIFKKALLPRLNEQLNILYNLQSYREMIEECASVQISENDSLPKNICKICSKQLEQSYKLKVQCLSSEKVLQNVTKNLKIGTTVPNLLLNNTIIEDRKDGLCENSTLEVIVKQEIIEDTDDENESKLNINCNEQVSDSVKEDDSSIDSKQNNITFTDEYIITKKEEPEDLELDELNKNINDIVKYKCQDCPDEFTTKIELTNHYRQVHIKPRIKCEFCNKVFIVHSAFRNHCYNPKLRCKVCLKEFGCRPSLTNHLKEHNACEICGKTFRSLHVYKKHACSTIVIQERKPCFLCPYCGKTFTEKWNFEQHVMVHSDERTYQCKICDSKFNTPHLLKLHLITHTNERPYECDVCKKNYKYSSALRRHKVSHTNYRIPCNFCDKLWKSKDTLRKHQLVHTGERKFICTYCNKPFGRQDNLHVHLRIHTGEKPFVCDKCGTGFSAKHVLRGHMKTHER